MTNVRVFIVATVLALMPAPALGQAEQPRSLAWDVAHAVLIDPTTYAPAVISYKAIQQDWNTSQILFENGWVEQNPRFTVSGKANDVPVSYNEGNRRIRGAALTMLRNSTMNNVSTRLAERLLIARYPRRKKLIRTLSWVERIAFASVTTYRNSADHLRQASTNRRLARAYAYLTP